MRRLILFISLCFATHSLDAQALHYLVKKIDTCVESKWEADPSGNRCLNYYNSDFCDYLRFMEDEIKVLRPGKTTVYTQKKSEVESAYRYGKKYYLYRGRYPKSDFDPFFVYALPLKTDSKVIWRIDTSEPKRTLQFKVEPRDTVYASRSGVACRTLSEKDGVLLYHNDHTFAGYLNLSEVFVVPGQEVVTGEPIGLAGHRGVSLTIFFLDRNLFTVDKYIVHPYTHISPVFRTDKGDIRLEENVEYKAVVDDALIMSEMSKAEKKRYVKNHKK